MKQRKLILILAIVLSVAIAAGGTMAYLQDTDEDVNVMTLGNVYIKQNEQERNEQGELVQFTQGKPMYPAVYEGDHYPADLPENWPVANDYAWEMTEQNENVIDKIVTVTNTGKSPAYVRTYIAFEGIDSYGPEGGCVRIVNNGSNVKDEIATELVGTTQVNGVDYTVYAYTYLQPLAPGETTIPSLKQVYLDKAAGNDEVAYYGETYDILVYSQAVQTEGFADAQTALDEAFGKTTEAEIPWGELKWPGFIMNGQESYDSSLTAGEYTLGDDIKTSDAENHYSGNREYAIKSGLEYTLNLNGYTLTHDGTYQDGKNTGYTYLYTTAYNGKLTINGEGEIRSENTEGNCCIVYAQGPSEVVINGGDFYTTRGIAVWAGNNSKVTINGGSFISYEANQNEELIYSSGGVIDIYGGFFHNTEWEGRPVNVADANRGTGFINIYGGTFVNFDPSTGGNDPANIKVMEGYTVVSETKDNGDIWYTVVKE